MVHIDSIEKATLGHHLLYPFGFDVRYVAQKVFTSRHQFRENHIVRSIIVIETVTVAGTVDAVATWSNGAIETAEDTRRMDFRLLTICQRYVVIVPRLQLCNVVE